MIVRYERMMARASVSEQVNDVEASDICFKAWPALRHLCGEASDEDGDV